MGYDHAEQKELDPADAPSNSSSGLSGSVSDEFEKNKEWEEAAEDDNDDAGTLPDLEGKHGGNKLDHEHTHHHHKGLLKLRSADDDLPTSWWFASTAIPLIAATFAPMANLISIAALVVPWRNRITQNRAEFPSTYQFTSVGYDDPQWCINLNIASLVCGFVGNLFLLFNFTKRVRYIVALPATIVLFYIASGILIGITASMNLHVPPDQGEVYSQGYWNAVIAACLYMFNSMILMVNMFGYFLGHYPQHFTLSDEQRNLILQTMMFFIWLGGGAGVFSRIEGWTYPDAVYFCDVTILTIGFGDFYPTDDVGRGLVFPYSVGGTIILGLMVSSIHKFAGELSKANVLRKHVEQKRVNTLSRVVTEDVEDKRRDELEKEVELEEKQGRRPTISSPLPSPNIQRDLDEAALRARTISRPDRPQGRQVEFEDTSAEELKKVDEDESEPHPNQFLRSAFRRGPIHTTMRIIIPALKKTLSKTEKKALVMKEEKDRFDAMRDIQLNAKKFKKWYALCLSVTAFGLLWCIGAVVFWQVEQDTQGLSYFQALYFCYVSLLTVGYGDLSPRSNAGKPFFVVWSLIAVPTMTILISDMGDTVISSFKRGTFKLGDLTVLPKAGLWHDIVMQYSWLYNFMKKRTEKKRRKSGFPVGPADGAGVRIPSIDQLASEELTEAQLTSRLAWAIRKTADDLVHSPYKRYTYEEWCEFTRLIRFTKYGLDQLEYDEETDGVVEWDWLEESSPMLSQQSESEWILDRLCESLLRLLKKNVLGSTSAIDATDPQSSSPDLSAFTFNRTGTMYGDLSTDHKPTRSTQGKGKATEPSQVNPTQERQRRASGADAVLTFFTGDRKGTHAYATEGPQWSKKGQERMHIERRRSSGGRKRVGPFSKLIHHGKTGTVGGGRGGAGLRTLKMRHFTGDGEGHR
ncbi:Potassium channel [Cladophialophora chaetospira]|uniref:Potassium channel n=1 Tax=Cladophialophora chaetospira TaxID=386627 RepID=A0AA39CEG9_9EURO|nr:Potassium channel [Cladophialophora chaetospira]